MVVAAVSGKYISTNRRVRDEVEDVGWCCRSPAASDTDFWIWYNSHNYYQPKLLSCNLHKLKTHQLRHAHFYQQQCIYHTQVQNMLRWETIKLTRSSIIPGEPIVLTFSMNGISSYLQADGAITNLSSQAADFSVTPSGFFISENGYLSTSRDVAIQPFAISPDAPGMKRASRVFGRFLVNLDRILEWINDAFTGGRAIFCVSGSTLMVVFNGVTPPGCIAIQLGAIPASDLNPGLSTSTIALPLSTSSNMPIVSTVMTQPPSSSGLPFGAGSTANPIISTSMTPPPPVSWSQVSSPSGPGSPSAASGATSNVAPPQSSSNPTPSTSGSDYPAPTTTGTPNCFDRSPFDGTVNDDFLLLCDTGLPGYELDAVPASDIAECIDACRAYVQTSEVTCVAVEFDIVSLCQVVRRHV